jgi:hypothetical protein
LKPVCPPRRRQQNSTHDPTLLRSAAQSSALQTSCECPGTPRPHTVSHSDRHRPKIPTVRRTSGRPLSSWSRPCTTGPLRRSPLQTQPAARATASLGNVLTSMPSPLELAKDVASSANADGGLMVFGVATVKGRHRCRQRNPHMRRAPVSAQSYRAISGVGSTLRLNGSKSCGSPETSWWGLARCRSRPSSRSSSHCWCTAHCSATSQRHLLLDSRPTGRRYDGNRPTSRACTPVCWSRGAAVARSPISIPFKALIAPTVLRGRF